MARDRLVFARNGKRVELADVGVNETLLDWLRLREGTKGTKEGCNEGDCGACTVALGRLREGRLVYEPVNACIQLLAQIDGADLVTVDDLAQGGALHPVQEAMVAHHGSQCGFCTPGIVMSLFTLYHAGVKPDRAAVDDWLAGNLCRCTGYRPIADAALDVIDGKAADALAARRDATAALLKQMDDGQDLFVGTADGFVAAPASAESLAALAAAHPDARIVSGATDVGLWITKQLRVLPKVILTGRAKGFAEIEDSASELVIGAGATYAQAFDALAGLAPDIGEVLRRLGSRQVRASGTVGGNIANGSPIGDMPPMLIALGADLELRHGDTARTIPLEDFFLAYGKQDRAAGELVWRIRVPKPEAGQHFKAFKISKRFDQDISAVLAAFNITVAKGKVAGVRIAFGGMAATPKRALATEAALAGVRIGDDAAVATAAAALAEDFQPIDDMRASAGYRMTVAKNLLRKACAEIAGAPPETTRVLASRALREAAE